MPLAPWFAARDAKARRWWRTRSPEGGGRRSATPPKRIDGETGAGRVLSVVKNKTEPIRQLAYRLYTLCERRGWAEDARAYNDLVTTWAVIENVVNAAAEARPQLTLFGD